MVFIKEYKEKINKNRIFTQKYEIKFVRGENLLFIDK